MTSPIARTTWAFWAYLAVYVTLQVAYGVRTAFMPAENDILGIMSIARGLTLAD